MWVTTTAWILPHPPPAPALRVVQRGAWVWVAAPPPSRGGPVGERLPAGLDDNNDEDGGVEPMEVQFDTFNVCFHAVWAPRVRQQRRSEGKMARQRC